MPIAKGSEIRYFIIIVWTRTYCSASAKRLKMVTKLWNKQIGKWYKPIEIKKMKLNDKNNFVEK